ncbi:hypothetical protein QUC31_005402 [Theobroma cacao]
MGLLALYILFNFNPKARARYTLGRGEEAVRPSRGAGSPDFTAKFHGIADYNIADYVVLSAFMTRLRPCLINLFTRIFIATLLLLAFVAISSTAQAKKQTYIVHLDRTKIKTAYQSLDNSKPWYEAMLNSIADVSSQEEDGSEATPPQLLYAYETGTKQLPLVYGKTAGGQGAEHCIAGSLNRDLVQGKMVVCQRGENARTENGEVVKMAGGAGMLLINTENDGEELLADSHVLPASSLGDSAGKAIKKYMNSTKSPTASIVFKGTTYGNRAPTLAAFSSRGPNLVGLDVIKPDVTAPGVDILAAWPAITSPSELKSDKRRVLFNIISGTSMSCPHVSGIAALLKSKHKDWSPAAIKSALMTTAYVADNKGTPILDVASGSSATPFGLGSGHADPERASDPGLIYDISPKDYIYYLCSLKYTDSQISGFVYNFTCPKDAIMQPGDLNYPSFVVNFKSSAAENITLTYHRTVTNVGTPKSTYDVLVEEPEGVSVVVTPKVLTFNMLGEKLSYKVTFTGLKRTKPVAASSFGSLVWVSGNYRVRSPIAASWLKMH